ncbi:dihydrodipicolinate synthetase family protein [Annulohypoxylon bovei var. microspora]|nr:dihydrodipicolinate synthetase family protein [Annulohypoxylon bovei var. microspora]
MVRIPPPGVYVPSPTFFKPLNSGAHQAEVDVATQSEHSVFLAKNGVHGLVLLGSTGEAVHLSRSERRDLLGGVRKGLDTAGFPDYPIMAGVLVNAVDEALEWLQDSKDVGCQWGLVLAPGYFGGAASQEGLVEWYTTVADKSPIPILIYNYPGVTNGLTVIPETYEKLAKHPNIVGCKMSHGNVSYHVQVSTSPEIDHEKFQVFSGFGQQLGPIVVFNAAGVIDGLASFFPKTVVRLFELVGKRPIDDAAIKEARVLQYRVSRAEDYIGRWGILGIREGIYRVAGLGNLEGGRAPLRGKIPEGAWEEWAGVMKAMSES